MQPEIFLPPAPQPMEKNKRNAIVKTVDRVIRHVDESPCQSFNRVTRYGKEDIKIHK